MKCTEGDQQIEFLITVEKENIRTENSQQQLSFNLSVTAKNSTVKKVECMQLPRWDNEGRCLRFDQVDDNDFFDNFEKYCTVKGLTPLKPEDSQELKESTYSSVTQDMKCSIVSKEGVLSRKCQRGGHLHDKDSKLKLKQILKEHPLKPFQNDFIKINNISPLLIGNKSRIDRKNTPQNHITKQSKTVQSTRKNHSTLVIRNGSHQPASPSIFFNKKSINDILHRNQSREVQNQILTKVPRMFKRRLSNKSWVQDILKHSPTFSSIRV